MAEQVRKSDAGRGPCPVYRTASTRFRAVAPGPVLAPGRGVSRARPIIKGVRLLLTRRVRGQVLLLTPSKRTNRIVAYVAAVIAKKWGIWLHAIAALGNHWHVCLTDPHGNIVAFERDCHQFIARAVNAHHGEFESLWSSAPTSRVECEEPDDLVGKIAYTMANPVEAGMVRYGKSWPGVRRAWPSKPRVIKRPPKFFRGHERGGKWPKEAVLEFTRPPGYDELSDDVARKLIMGQLATGDCMAGAGYPSKEHVARSSASS